MSGRALLESGDLEGALSALTRAIQQNPADKDARSFFFELLLFSGDLDRAEKHLRILADAEGQGRNPYFALLQGERFRRDVWAGRREPGLPGNRPAYASLHIEAISKICSGQGQAAYDLLARSMEERSQVQLQVDGEALADLRDAADLLGPFLEVITPTNYAWIPWEIVESIEFTRPSHLIDLFWLPAGIELTIGPLGEAYVPVLYHGSHQAADPQVKLGRATQWIVRDNLAFGCGQRLLTDGDQREFPILEVRRIQACRSEDNGGIADPIV